MEGMGIEWVQAYDSVIVGYGRVVIAGLGERVAAVIEGLYVAGVESQGPRIIGDCILKAAEFTPGVATVVEGGGITAEVAAGGEDGVECVGGWAMYSIIRHSL